MHNYGQSSIADANQATIGLLGVMTSWGDCLTDAEYDLLMLTKEVIAKRLNRSGPERLTNRPVSRKDRDDLGLGQ